MHNGENLKNDNVSREVTKKKKMHGVTPHAIFPSYLRFISRTHWVNGTLKVFGKGSNMIGRFK